MNRVEITRMMDEIERIGGQEEENLLIDLIARIIVRLAHLTDETPRGVCEHLFKASISDEEWRERRAA